VGNLRSTMMIIENSYVLANHLPNAELGIYPTGHGFLALTAEAARSSSVAAARVRRRPRRYAPGRAIR
jgi:hypothetical protein